MDDLLLYISTLSLVTYTNIVMFDELPFGCFTFMVLLITVSYWFLTYSQNKLTIYMLSRTLVTKSTLFLYTTILCSHIIVSS